MTQRFTCTYNSSGLRLLAGLSCNRKNVQSESGFSASRGVSVEHAFADCFVDLLVSKFQSFGSAIGVGAFDRVFDFVAAAADGRLHLFVAGTIALGNFDSFDS